MEGQIEGIKKMQTKLDKPYAKGTTSGSLKDKDYSVSGTNSPAIENAIASDIKWRRIEKPHKPLNLSRSSEDVIRKKYGFGE